MQAALNDVSAHRESSSFAICQRVLHRCHEIIFGDQLLPSASPYSGFVLPAYARRRKIKHHAEPVFVGIGVVLAGVPAMPQLAEITGQVAIEQGRIDEEGDNMRGFGDDSASYSVSPIHSTNDDLDETDSPESIEEEFQPKPIRKSTSEIPDSQRTVLGRRRTLGAQTLPALPLHLQLKGKPRLSEDPLGQLDSDTPVLPYQSSPSLASGRTPSRSAAINRADLLLEKYDVQSQMHLLRGHYYLSEVCLLCIPPLYRFEIPKGSIFTQP